MASVTFQEKIAEGTEIGKKLTNYGLSLMKNFPKDDTLSEAESDRRAVAKGYVITASQLSGQIIKAVNNGSLSLAILGIRTLLEFSIDANYIYDNPEHKGEIAWIDSLCNDCFKRINDHDMFRNKLGNVTLKDRAISIGRKDLYAKNYVYLCDYSHLVLRQPFLNQRNTFEKLSIDAISQALCQLTDVLDAILVYFGIPWDEDLKNAVISYRDRFESNVIDKPSP